MKHIETILPEHAADELTRLLLDDATILSALKELLHRDTGCDIPSLDNVPTSDIEEIIPLCLSILRGFWNTPLTALGDGTSKKSLADTFKRLINNRVQGNEVFGIPAVNGSVTEALSALLERKITGASEVADGMSLVQLLCGPALNASLTTLTDTTTGWTMDKNVTGLWNTYLPALQSITMGCIESNYPIAADNATIKHLSFPNLIAAHVLAHHANVFNNLTALETVDMPNFEDWSTNWMGPDLFQNCAMERIYLPKFKRFSSGNASGCFNNCPNLKEIICPQLVQIATYLNTHLIYNCQELTKVIVGKIGYYNGTDSLFNESGYANLIHLEIKGEQNNSINLFNWSPTTALAERLDEFLSNFQTYIADRVADRTGKTALTLTLSAAVYEALQAQEGQTILATLTNKNWTVAQA